MELLASAAAGAADLVVHALFDLGAAVHRRFRSSRGRTPS
jgi:hypothetical protein